MLARAPAGVCGAIQGIGRMPQLRKSLWSAVLGLALAAPAPAISATTTAAPSALPINSALSIAPLAESWSWDAFVKFWKRQLDRTAGVVGVVLLVGASAVVIIISRARR